jgi:TonB family protein
MRTDPRNHTKHHESSWWFFVLLRVTSWIVRFGYGLSRAKITGPEIKIGFFGFDSEYLEMKVGRHFLFLIFIVFVVWPLASLPQTLGRRLNVAVVDFGSSTLGRVASDRVAAKLKSGDRVNIVDREGSRLAVHGAGYAGSLNLSLKEARDLGDAIGCDFYLIGDAQTLRRSTSKNPIYFESYASIFLVSSRSGKLVTWERPSFEAGSASAAEQSLIEELSREDLSHRYLAAMQKAHEEEQQQRQLAIESVMPVIEEAPADEKAAEAGGLRLPRPYRRLRPAYPETAARADAEAVVDVLVDLDATGEVSRIDLARWAGFGLDEASLNTARQLHFFPAMRNGTPVPIRVLLRYNFRKSAK